MKTDESWYIYHYNQWQKYLTTRVFLVVISTLTLLYLILKLQFYRDYQLTGRNFIFNYNLAGTTKTVGRAPIKSDILLFYVYAESHPQAYGNLKYFIEHAVRESDGVDYYFILQQVKDVPVNETELPKLPKTNARYIQHENKCFDFGTVGWFIDTYTFGNPWKNETSINISGEERQLHSRLNLTAYKYFILMNSSVRGPFFPPYFLKLLSDGQSEVNKTFYWYSVFTSRLNNEVKLVGPLISCETVPHVQSHIMATDFIGLSIMLKPGSSGGSVHGIFHCYPTKTHASLNSELSSSNRIIEAGYMLDSLLTKYQKINFTDPRNRQCNGARNPFIDKNLDGTTQEPYEVVFIKYNDQPWIAEQQGRAALYQRWTEEVTKENRTI